MTWPHRAGADAHHDNAQLRVRTTLLEYILVYMADDQYLLRQRKPSFWKRLSSERLISLAALLVSLAAAAFTGWYAWDTHAMRVEARIAAEKQTVDIQHSRIASERSATAAERSARAAEDVLRQTVEGGRARLSHVLANASPLVAGQRPTADCMLTNKGRRTATRIIQSTWMSVLNSNTDQLPHPPTKLLKAGTLASDDKIMTGMILSKPLSAQELADIRSGTKALFLYGDAEYLDESGEQHTLEWCSQYTSDVPVVFGMLQTCRMHNSSR